MKEKLPGHYRGALDTQVWFLRIFKHFADGEKSLLRPDDLRRAVQELVLLYDHSFGLVLPDLNHPWFLFRYVRDLGLPRKYKA